MELKCNSGRNNDDLQAMYSSLLQDVLSVAEGGPMQKCGGASICRAGAFCRVRGEQPFNCFHASLTNGRGSPVQHVQSHHSFLTVSSITKSTAASIGRIMTGIAERPISVGIGERSAGILPTAHTSRLITIPGIAMDASPCHRRLSAASTAG
eukprot:scaffold18296_cov32-Tisochrysis_lutea.AAC.1